MTTEQQQGGTATNKVGQQVELGRPHQPLPNERKHGQTTEPIDMNPGEPARPFVGGDGTAKAVPGMKR